MKHTIYLLLLLAPFLCTGSAKAQGLTLKDALTQALTNNPDHLIRQIVIRQNKQRLKKEVSSKLPDLTLQTGTQRNFIIASTPIPAKLLDPDAPDDKIYAAPFGTKYSGNAGIHLNCDLFNPDRYGNIALQKIKTSIAEADAENTKQVLIATICLDYAAAVIASEQAELCLLDKTRSARAFFLIRKRKFQGQATEEEYLTACQDTLLAETRLVQAQNILAKSRYRLLADMGAPVMDKDSSSSLDLTDSMEELVCAMETDTLRPSLPQNSPADRLQLELKRQECANFRIRMIPTISLVGYIGSNFYSEKYAPFNLDNWYGNCYLGIRLTYPLTALFGKAYDYGNSRLRYREEQYRTERNTIRRNHEIRSYDSDMRSYRKEMSLRKKTMELAERKYAAMSVRFSEGQIHLSDLFDALYETRKAKADYLECMYNYFTAAANRHISLHKQ